MRYVLATALGVSAALCAPSAHARDTRYAIDIGAVNAAAAIALLSAQTGTSFAIEQPLPRRAIRAVRGNLTVREALDRILGPLDFRATRAGAHAYRITRRKDRAPQQPAANPAPQPDEDIVITGRKRSEPLSKVPGSVAVYVPGLGERSGVSATTRDVADTTTGLTLTNGGPGYSRLFVRGVADSPFNSFSQSTVSVQFDDTRVTFDAPEPGLRLVDVTRVEVLKGPQGPLYGTGALGGVYRIVSNRPLLDQVEAEATLGASSVTGGGSGVQADAVLNLPLITDRLALRIAGYTADEPGWIDDLSGGRDLNRALTRGARVAVRAVPLTGWTADLSALVQSIDAKDSQYFTRPGENRVRDLTQREPHFTETGIVQGTLTGPLGALRLTVSSGHTWQVRNEAFDAAASAGILGVKPPVLSAGNWEHHVFDQEVRIGSPADSRVSWIAGASYLTSSTQGSTGIFSGPSAQSGPYPEFRQLLALWRRVSEIAVYADGSVPIGDRARLGLGLRAFRTGTDDVRFGELTTVTRAKTSLGVTPNASFSYELAPDALVYARFATAFRPGGIDPNNVVTRRYEADEVRTVDVGGRLHLLNERLYIDAGFFFTNWRNIQADHLEKDGLTATRNAGTARIYGTEFSAVWRVGGGWRIDAGGTWQQPRLIRAADGTGVTPPIHLPLVPDVSARLLVAREMDMAGWRLTPSVSANFTGATWLSLDPGLNRRMPGSVVTRFVVSATRGRSSLRVNVDNLLDTKADTLAFGNPFSVWAANQYTPYRPRTVSFSASRRF